MGHPRWRIADLMTLTCLAAILMVVARTLPDATAQPKRPGVDAVSGLLAGLFGLCVGGLFQQSPLSLALRLPLRLAWSLAGGASLQGPPTPAFLGKACAIYLVTAAIGGALIGSIGGYLSGMADRHGYTKSFWVAVMGLYLGWVVGPIVFRRPAYRGPSPAVSTSPAVDSTGGPD